MTVIILGNKKYIVTARSSKDIAQNFTINFAFQRSRRLGHHFRCYPRSPAPHLPPSPSPSRNARAAPDSAWNQPRPSDGKRRPSSPDFPPFTHSFIHSFIHPFQLWWTEHSTGPSTLHLSSDARHSGSLPERRFHRLHKGTMTPTPRGLGRIEWWPAKRTARRLARRTRCRACQGSRGSRNRARVLGGGTLWGSWEGLGSWRHF